MAVGVGFEGANFVMLAPKSMGPDECLDLECYREESQIISCWRFTPEELEEINRTGVCWLRIVGNGMPPVAVCGHAQVLVNGKPAQAEPALPRARRSEE